MTSSPNGPLVVIAAGGTGGHMFPAEAFAHEMTARGWRVGLISDERGNRYAGNFPLEWSGEVSAATFTSKRPDKVLYAAWKIRRGIAEARDLLKERGAALVAGFGGYPAFPAMAAASKLGLPTLLHEQNAVLGRVNRHFANRAGVIACGFSRLDRLPKAAASRKTVVGNPVRPPILKARDLPYPSVAQGSTLRLLVIGGSQGAQILGRVVPEAIAGLDPAIRARVEVVQQVREEQLDEVRSVYEAAGVQAELSPFFDNMAERLAACHLVISRSGASSVTELQVVGRPSVLVPLAIATDDHQTANAETLANAEAADVLAEPAFTAPALTAVLNQRLADGPGLARRASAARETGQPDAARTLADLAVGLVEA